MDHTQRGAISSLTWMLPSAFVKFDPTQKPCCQCARYSDSKGQHTSGLKRAAPGVVQDFVPRRMMSYSVTASPDSTSLTVAAHQWSKSRSPWQSPAEAHLPPAACCRAYRAAASYCIGPDANLDRATAICSGTSQQRHHYCDVSSGQSDLQAVTQFAACGVVPTRPLSLLSALL